MAVVLLLLTGLVTSCGEKEPSSPTDPNSPNVTEGQKFLIEAVQSYGAHSADGKFDSLICSLSEEHLTYMIQKGKISHDGFSDRSSQLRSSGYGGTGEIVASNCGSGSLRNSAEQCADSWRNSSGHWDSMRKSWKSYCYAIRQTGNCSYCIGLFAN